MVSRYDGAIEAIEEAIETHEYGLHVSIKRYNQYRLEVLQHPYNETVRSLMIYYAEESAHDENDIRDLKSAIEVLRRAG